MRLSIEGRRAYQQNESNALNIQNAVRLAVEEAFAQELEHRARGLRPEEAQELTRLAMWTPPAWPR